MSVPGATLAGWLGISEDELSKTPKGARDGDWTIAPKHKENMFVSYTRKKAAAWRFAESFADDHPYSVIFHAFVSNNQGVFLDIESMLGRIEQSHLDVDPEDEAEKATLGPVKVSCIEWRLAEAQFSQKSFANFATRCDARGIFVRASMRRIKK